MIGDAARRRVLRPARGRPRRQRRRRAARPRRHGARAGRRPLHHRRAQHAPAEPPHRLQHRLALRQRHRAAQLRDIVVTEYGIADLRGKSDRDCHRRHAGASPTAPSSRRCRRGAARRQARARPSRCRRTRRQPPSASKPRSGRHGAMACCRRFPLGTEMTEVEQSLAAPVRLKCAGYADLASMALAGLPSAPSASDAAALERMSLAAPSSLGDRVLRIACARRAAAADPLLMERRPKARCALERGSSSNKANTDACSRAGAGQQAIG